jgi:hypothetical protein
MDKGTELIAAAANGEEQRSPTEEDEEKADLPLWLMLVPTSLLLIVDLPGAEAAGDFAAHAAANLMHPGRVHRSKPACSGPQF